MSHYFQCSKCKILKELDDTKFETKQITQEDDNIIDITTIKKDNLNEIICHDRRMRELTKDQYDHEVIQRDYIDGKGPAPSSTNLMNSLNLSP